MMDQKPAHDVGGEAQKSLAIRSVVVGLDSSDFQQLEIQLIHQNGGLPSVGRPLASHAAELGAERGHQLPGRFFAATPEVFQEPCDPVQILLFGLLDRHAHFDRPSRGGQ